MRNTTLRQLRALIETVRCGTVTGAAEALHVTPPAISLQLKLLEAQAAIKLIEKHDSGYRPTLAGAVLLKAAQQVEAILSEAGEAVSAIRGGTGGTVRVGVVSTAKYFAPRALAAFRRAHPKVEIQLSVGNRGETIDALQSFHLDFAVMGRPPKQFAVVQDEIGAHPHIIVAPPDHPLASRKRIKPKRLGNETFLMRETGSGTRLLTEWLLNQIGSQAEIGMELGSNETIKQAVMAGLGIALISAHTVSVELSEGRLAMLDIDGLPIVRHWFIVRRADKQLMPAAQSLWDFLAGEGHSFLPDLKSP